MVVQLKSCLQLHAQLNSFGFFYGVDIMNNFQFSKPFKYWLKYLCLGALLGSMAGTPPLIQAQGNSVTTVPNMDSPQGQILVVCTPTSVHNTTTKIYVNCAANTTDATKFFAYPVSSGNADFLTRSFRIMLTAFVSGKNVGIYYDPNSTSTTTCQPPDCREISSGGVDIR